jgi:hypothetical protein
MKNQREKNEKRQPILTTPYTEDEAHVWAKEVEEEYEQGEFIEWEDFKLSAQKKEYAFTGS